MAIKILICDDLIAEAEKIRKMIELYAEKAMLPFDVTICSSPNEIAEKIQNSALFDILFLDEILDAVALGVLSEEKLISFLEHKPYGLEIIMTGHDISERMLALADYATEMHKMKHPFDEGKIAREGIEY